MHQTPGQNPDLVHNLGRRYIQGQEIQAIMLRQGTISDKQFSASHN
jgi:hypothetical protein